MNEQVTLVSTIITITAAVVAGIWHLRSHIDGSLKQFEESERRREKERDEIAKGRESDLKDHIHSTFAKREDLAEMRSDIRAMRQMLEHVLGRIFTTTSDENKP